MGAFLSLLGSGLKDYGKSVKRGIRSDLEEGAQGLLDPLQRRKRPGDIGLPDVATGQGTAIGAPGAAVPWDEDYGFAAPGAGTPLPQVDPEEQRRRRLGILDDINPYGPIF